MEQVMTVTSTTETSSTGSKNLSAIDNVDNSPKTVAHQPTLHGKFSKTNGNNNNDNNNKSVQPTNDHCQRHQTNSEQMALINLFNQQHSQYLKPLGPSSKPSSSRGQFRKSNSFGCSPINFKSDSKYSEEEVVEEVEARHFGTPMAASTLSHSPSSSINHPQRHFASSHIMNGAGMTHETEHLGGHSSPESSPSPPSISSHSLSSYHASYLSSTPDHNNYSRSPATLSGMTNIQQFLANHSQSFVEQNEFSEPKSPSSAPVSFSAETPWKAKSNSTSSSFEQKKQRNTRAPQNNQQDHTKRCQTFSLDFFRKHKEAQHNYTHDTPDTQHQSNNGGLRMLSQGFPSGRYGNTRNSIADLSSYVVTPRTKQKHKESLKKKNSKKEQETSGVGLAKDFFQFGERLRNQVFGGTEGNRKRSSSVNPSSLHSSKHGTSPKNSHFISNSTTKTTTSLTSISNNYNTSHVNNTSSSSSSSNNSGHGINGANGTCNEIGGGHTFLNENTSPSSHPSSHQHHLEQGQINVMNRKRSSSNGSSGSSFGNNISNFFKQKLGSALLGRKVKNTTAIIENEDTSETFLQLVVPTISSTPIPIENVQVMSSIPNTNKNPNTTFTSTTSTTSTTTTLSINSSPPPSSTSINTSLSSSKSLPSTSPPTPTPISTTSSPNTSLGASTSDSSSNSDEHYIKQVKLNSGVIIKESEDNIYIESPRMTFRYKKHKPGSASQNQTRSLMSSSSPSLLTSSKKLVTTKTSSSSKGIIVNENTMLITPRSRRKQALKEQQNKRKQAQKNHNTSFKQNAIFYMAVKENNTEKVKDLLTQDEETMNKDTSSEMIDINFQYSLEQSQTALHVCAKENNISIMEMLITNGAMLDIVDALCRTPLHVAANFGSHEAMILLLSHGATANMRDTYGNSPFHLGLKQHYFDLCRDLLLFGADVNFKKHDGSTSLHDAMYHGDCKVVSFLIDVDGGINSRVLFNSRDERGEPPIFKAIEGSQKDSLVTLLRFNRESKRVTLKVDNQVGQNMLHIAALESQSDYLGWLIVELIDNKHLTVEEVQTMLNASDRKENTILHYIAKNNKSHTFRALMETVDRYSMQLNLNCTDEKGFTPLYIMTRKIILSSHKGTSSPAPKFTLELEGPNDPKAPLYEMIVELLRRKASKIVKTKSNDTTKNLCKRNNVDFKQLTKYWKCFCDSKTS